MNNYLRALSFVFPSLAAKMAMKIFLKPQKIDRPNSELDWHNQSKKYFILDKYAAFEWGPANGEIICLLHGWAGRGTQLGAFAEPLLTKGYRVIAIDGPAHGQSLGEETNAGDFARAIIEIQKELSSVNTIIAHSFGAGCSVLAMKWGLSVKKLVLIASPSDYEKVVSNFLKFISISTKSQKIFNSLLSQKAKISPQELKISNIGKELSIPIMIVHDQQDKEVPYDSALDLHRAWAHSKLFSTNGLGHKRILKDSSTINHIVDFVLNVSR